MTDAQGAERPLSRIEWCLLIGGGLVIVAFAVMAARFAHGFVDRTGVVGVGVTVAGLLVAVLIFLKQGRSSAASEGRLSDRIAQNAVATVQNDQADAQAEDVPDNFPVEYAGLGAPVPGASEVLRLEPDEVPLQLIRDLVSGWEQANEDGSWTVGDLRLVLRRKGKGNHAWWFVFRRPNGEHLLKMSRGGRGNGPGDITVKEVTS